MNVLRGVSGGTFIVDRTLGVRSGAYFRMVWIFSQTCYLPAVIKLFCSFRRCRVLRFSSWERTAKEAMNNAPSSP